MDRARTVRSKGEASGVHQAVVAPGNSPTAVRSQVSEVHSEEWLRKMLLYLTDCELHRKGLLGMGRPAPLYATPPPFPHFPTPRWFLSVYVRDVWGRLPELRAEATSTFGRVLKVDSTKKICRKLQGSAANTASWATNVGNEWGEVLASVLTVSESMDSLETMAVGLMHRLGTHVHSLNV